MSPAVKAAIITLIITFLVLITVSVLQRRRNLISKRMYLYVFFPLLPLPLALTLTYIVWPEHTLHWAVRILIAVAVDALAMANFYFFSVPFYKVTIPEFKKYFFEKEEENQNNTKVG